MNDDKGKKKTHNDFLCRVSKTYLRSRREELEKKLTEADVSENRKKKRLAALGERIGFSPVETHPARPT
jgi:hypothetical protein